MTFALSLTALVAVIGAWLWTLAWLLHQGTDPVPGSWRYTAGAAVWFLGGVFVAAYLIGGNR